MNDLNIKETLETPGIEFNTSKGYLLIKGRSIPENSVEFYEPLFDALRSYSERPKQLTKVDFKFEYFNTSSSKCILDLLRAIEKINDGSIEVAIDWFYDEDDDEILEIGEDYSQFINVPFNLRMIPNN